MSTGSNPPANPLPYITHADLRQTEHELRQELRDAKAELKDDLATAKADTIRHVDIRIEGVQSSLTDIKSELSRMSDSQEKTSERVQWMLGGIAAIAAIGMTTVIKLFVG